MTKTNVLLALCGTALLVWMVREVGWQTLLAVLSQIGWRGLLVLVVLFAVAQLPCCLGWLWLLGSSQQRASVWMLYGPYAAGDALNLTVPSADTIGEVAKVWMLKHRLPWEHVAASVTLHKVCELIALSLLLSLGFVVSWMRVDLPGWWYGVGGAVIVAKLGLVAGFFRLQQRGVFEPLFRNFLTRFRASAQSGQTIDREIRCTLAKRDTFLLATSMVFLSWAAGIGEAYLCLRWLGLRAQWDIALTVESFGILIGSIGFFVPGKLGVGEGGRMLLLIALGFPMAEAMAFAVVRRLRECAWILVGLVFLLVHQMRRGHEMDDVEGLSMTHAGTSLGEKL